MRRRTASAIALAAAVVLAGAVAAADCPPPRAAATTALGMKYCADPAFAPAVAGLVPKLRQEIRGHRAAGRLVVYASTPISPRGGGHTAVNLAIAASVKARLEKEYGAGLWVLDPGRYQLPDVGGKAAGGGDYMVMWTEVLGGADVTGCLGRWVAGRAATDDGFRRDGRPASPAEMETEVAPGYGLR